MKVTTDKGKTIPIDWMYPQRSVTERLMIGLHDSRPLTEIAADFAGCEHLHRESAEEGDADFDGYTEPVTLSRPSFGVDNDNVLVVLSRPVKED